MYAFHNSDEFGMAAHALSLATLRGHATDRTGLMGLATEILSQAQPSAFLDSDDLLGRVLAAFGGDVWDRPATDRCADPIQAIEKVTIDQGTLLGAMKLLNRTELSHTLEDAEDAELDVSMLVLSVLVALYLALDIKPRAAIEELSEGRVTTPVVTDLLEAGDLWVLQYWTHGRMPILRMGAKGNVLRELIVHVRRNWHDAVGKGGHVPMTPPTDHQEAIDAFFGPISESRGYVLQPFQPDPTLADRPY